MRALPASDRKLLSTAVLDARRAAESACRAAIDGLGVFADKRPEHLDADQAALRNGLRAKWRQLDGDRELLIAECAYEQWHRLLFARFLTENNLLLHPQYEAPVTLIDCGDLAAELGEPDAWSVAARFASEILPGIFRVDDPCVRLRLAPEGRHALEQILDGLPAELFMADDALGWVYQFWQKDKKDEVNASERKIGGADIGPVTQLFTENYMVRFLLENSLGAWWAARHPESPLVKGFEYLRFDDDGKPAAGSFDRWPERVAEVTVMDPCCGSAHFLVEAFSMLWQMRVEEEGLSPVEAQDAVLRDNLFGLEIDPRCVQIAMFAISLQAWKVAQGWRLLPIPGIACSGIAARAKVAEWAALAGADERLAGALARLHELFIDADTLGSLIDPTSVGAGTYPAGTQLSLNDADWNELSPLVQMLSDTEAADPGLAVVGAHVASIANAASLLSARYVLVVTNVPYLSSINQSRVLKSHLSRFYEEAKPDLATAFIMRCRALTREGSLALVTPQNWLILHAYRDFRRNILKKVSLVAVARLGSGAFDGVSGEVVKPLLSIVSCNLPSVTNEFAAFDTRDRSSPQEKAHELASNTLHMITQRQQSRNPDSRIVLSNIGGGPLLREYAIAYWGLGTGDDVRYVRRFWEIPSICGGWVRHQGAVARTTAYGGRERVLRWDGGRGDLADEPGAFIRGLEVWGSRGVAISQTGDLAATLYTGDAWNQNCAPIVPHDEEHLPAIWAYCSSPEFAVNVRKIDQSLKVTNATLVKVPFDLDRWSEVAEEVGPITKPASSDPTQWLFAGRPELLTASLQVAIGRLLGCCWPEQANSDELDVFTDSDGIVCVPVVTGEARAADRVQQLLAAAYGDSWSPAKLKELLEQSGSRKKNLAEWLRDEFFKQHCALFANRPFVWHIWDGLKDGFSALANYHRLDHKTLAKLTYSYLGQDWVERQRSEVRDEVAGAEARLTAALELKRKLELILDGEQPFDIYVRWKEKHEQPMGWEPDLNDGVRRNIRPFVTAGVLRYNPNIHWRKDRGKDPDGSERLNDLHRSLGEKAEARKRAGQT